MDDWTRNYLINSGVLDTETVSREAGSGFTEIGFYDFKTNKVSEFLPRPETVNVETGLLNDEANMRFFRGSKYERTIHSDWKEAIALMLHRE